MKSKILSVAAAALMFAACNEPLECIKTMKKITFLFAILLGVSFSSVAQQNLNLRFGYKIPTETFGKSNYPNVHGFEIGLSKDFKISEKFSFRPGLSYYFQWRTEKLGENYFLWETLYPEINVQKNSRIRNCFHFLEIPLMAAWKIGKFDLEIGPYVSYEFASRFSLAGKKISAEYGSDRFDVGFKGGFGYHLSEKYYIGLSYENGIRNLSKVSYDKSFTHNLSLNFGYNF